MSKFIKSTVALVAICAVMALLLAVTNEITAPLIAANESAKANSALLEVMPDGGNFEIVDTSSLELPKSVTEVYRASNGGYVFKLTANGYKPGMVIMCGVDANGVITGSKYLSGSETNGAELIMDGRVPGATLENIDGVDTATSPTAPLTVGGYLSAIKDALNAAIILGGGSVDLRTEEEILQDNLAAALPAADGAFEKHFFAEIVDGVDAISRATNGVGYGIVGGNEYHPASGEYILIRASISAEGRIIDCLTLSQKETDGIGSACADETFYGQFDGKTEENYGDIDAISGATMTTDGYKKAILRAFASVKMFEGRAE